MLNAKRQNTQYYINIANTRVYTEYINLLITMTLDYDLMRKANPLLFAPERYDQYPLQPQELMQYLTSASAQAAPRPATSADELDYLLYTGGSKSGARSAAESGPSLELDLEKKLACEFALYQTHMHRKDAAERPAMDFTALTKLKVGSEEWFDEMLGLLESINGTDIDLDALRGRNGGETRQKTLSVVGEGAGEPPVPTAVGADDAVSKDIPSSGADELQEVISYILSSAIKSGVDIRPRAAADGSQQEFLRGLVDEMLQRAGSASRDSGAAQDDNTALKNSELSTALGDLQLAHTFLTKQYENDRSTHAQDIAKLTRANRELQERLLQSHDELHSAHEQLREAKVGAPVPSADETSTPGSSSYSLGLMRTEFQRLLAESERNHEAELERERAARRELEKQLGR